MATDAAAWGAVVLAAFLIIPTGWTWLGAGMAISEACMHVVSDTTDTDGLL